jgi:hypothetical protein
MMQQRARIEVARVSSDPLIVTFPCDQYKVAGVQIVASHDVSGNWSCDVKGSIDGQTPVALATPVAIAYNSSSSHSGPIVISSFSYLHVILGTAGTAGFLDIHVTLKDPD